jgi:hypothetical protein
VHFERDAGELAIRVPPALRLRGLLRDLDPSRSAESKDSDGRVERKIDDIAGRLDAI